MIEPARLHELCENSEFNSEFRVQSSWLERASRGGSLRIQNSEFRIQTSESTVGESWEVGEPSVFAVNRGSECRIQEGRVHPEFYILKPVRSHLQNADSSPFRIQNSCFQNSDEFCKVSPLRHRPTVAWRAADAGRAVATRAPLHAVARVCATDQAPALVP